MGSTLHVEESTDAVDVTKTLHLSRLAAVLGRPLVTQICTNKTSIKGIYSNLIKKSIFRGAITCLMSIDKLNPTTVSNLATCLCAIRNAWFDHNQNKVELNMGDLNETLYLRESATSSPSPKARSPTQLNRESTKESHNIKMHSMQYSSYFTGNYLPHGFSFFCTVAPSSNTKMIPLKLQTVLRNVSLSIPKMEVLVRSLLLSAGFVSTDRLAPVLVRALHNCSEEFEGTKISVVHYTTIASAVQHAARHLEKMRQSNMEIAIELENTLDVWSEHNDAFEARSLRLNLVQCIYQQNMGESDASMLKEKLAAFMQREFRDFENLHRDPTKPFMKQDLVADEEKKEWTEAEAKYYDSCEKTGMIPTDGQRGEYNLCRKYYVYLFN